MDDYAPIFDVMFWVLVIGALASVGVYFIRRWLKSNEDFSSGGGFTIGDLRQLHRAGKMSDEEFEKAKALIVGRSMSAMNASKPTLPPGTTPAPVPPAPAAKRPPTDKAIRPVDNSKPQGQ